MPSVAKLVEKDSHDVPASKMSSAILDTKNNVRFVLSTAKLFVNDTP